MSFSLRGGFPCVQATAHPLPVIHARVLRDGIKGPGSALANPRTCVNSPLKESSELREVYFSRLFDIYLSHFVAVTQLLAEVIQPIQTAEIQGQRATFARFPHPDGSSSAQMFRKFRGQILSGKRGS